jgi:tetratricopeptide (TPR) repeat protein
MQLFRRLIHEAHRRSLWQVVAIYGVGSWAAYQVVGDLTERLALPDWVPGFAIVLFLIGLPIVVATAFVEEGMPGQAPRQPADADAPANPPVPEGSARTYEDQRVRSAPGAARPHIFFTWHRAIAAGITAFLLLGITAAGYVGLRNSGVGPFASLLSAGTIAERDRLIVAQFHDAGGDSLLASAVSEALRVDLAQSPVITVADARFTGAALQRMGRDVRETIDAALAREIAIREGVKAVLEGEITPAAGRYVLTARLLEASTGNVLVTHRETAAEAGDIIAAVDRLSRKLREKVGESLRTIRANEPLEAVTTASLAALQKYSRAVHTMETQNDYERGVPLLEEAVAIDSSFAMAWRKLGVAYYNTRAGRDRMAHAVTRAYALRDRLTERERYHAIGFYELNVTGEERKAITAYQSLLAVYPTDFTALNNIALAYNWIFEDGRAAEYYARAIAVDSFNANVYTNLALTLYRQGRKEEAQAILDVHRRRFPELREPLFYAHMFAQAEGAFDEAEKMVRQLREQSGESLLWRARANIRLAWLLRLRGQLQESRRHRLEVAKVNAERGVPGALLRAELEFIDEQQWFLQRPDLAQRQLDELLARSDVEALPVGDRPHLLIASMYARAGRPDRARAFIEQREKLPQLLRGDERAAFAYAKGFLALAEERPNEALTEFRVALEHDQCPTCPLVPLALAFEAAEQPDSAVAHYRKYIDSPDMERGMDEAWNLPLAYERIAELYERKGDRDNAVLAAARFVQLWEKADAALRPRVQAKQEMLRRLRQS